MAELDAVRTFDKVAALLPPPLRRIVAELPEDLRGAGEELRLRNGQPLFIVLPGGEEPVPGTRITEEILRTVLEIASRSSVHTVMEQLKNGFIPIRGGHRLGLSGTAVMRDGAVANLRAISSLSLRVAREYPGIARDLLPCLLGGDGPENTLICAPPGGGKTTLLRDLIRVISDGDGVRPLRVGVADERSELAAMWDGSPAFSLGCRTDVMDCCPKSVGLMILLRGMNPQVLAVDEITASDDVKAIRQAVGCGVRLMATAHAGQPEDLRIRPLYQTLLRERTFRRFVWISGTGSDRHYTVTDEEGRPC